MQTIAANPNPRNVEFRFRRFRPIRRPWRPARAAGAQALCRRWLIIQRMPYRSRTAPRYAPRGMPAGAAPGSPAKRVSPLTRVPKVLA
jgi:hypothetical protein